MRNSFPSSCNEGYAARPGGAQARLLAEINEHEEQHKQDRLLAKYRNYQQGTIPPGPAARALIEIFASVDGCLTAASDGGDDQIRSGRLGQRPGSAGPGR
ncbi:hypothetical protein ACWDYJ_09315 [Streptomyces sp. NPDC003042]